MLNRLKTTPYPDQPNKRRVLLRLIIPIVLLLLAFQYISVSIQTDSAVNNVYAQPSNSMETATPSPTATPVGVGYLPMTSGYPNWIRLGNMPQGASVFLDFSLCDTNKFAGTDIGLFSLSTDGNQWIPESDSDVTGAAVLSIGFVPDSDCSEAYVTMRGGGVSLGRYDSTTEKWSWERVDKGLDDALSIVIIEETIFASGPFGIQFKNPLPTIQEAWATTDVKDLVVSLTSPTSASNQILASRWGMGVFRKRAGSNTVWDPLEGNDTLSNKLIYKVAAANLDDGVAIVGTQTGIERWDGTRWSPVARDYAETTFTVIAVPNTSLNELHFYAGQRNNDVLVSLDSGITWNLLPGIDKGENVEFQVRGFYLSDDSQPTLYAATTSGIWRLNGAP